MEFENGDKVKDMLANLTGIINNTCIMLTGCTRSCIEVKSSKELPEGKTYWVDDIYLKMINKAHIKLCTDLKPKYKLGTTMTDIISKRSAVITSYTITGAGYIRYNGQLLDPKDLKELEEVICWDEIQVEQLKSKVIVKPHEIIKKLKKDKPAGSLKVENHR